MSSIRTYIKEQHPILLLQIQKFADFIKKVQYGDKYTEKLFTDYYNNNTWTDPDSVSGTGSNLQQTQTIRDTLPVIFNRYTITSLLDIPCGDFYWMKNINFGQINYIGADIVEDLIKKNNNLYEDENKKFTKLDLITDLLPKMDLILCRDCLVHFSYNDIRAAVNQIKRSQSKYLLTTTFINRKSNYNIVTGHWRPINLQMPPFNFPEPLEIIDEKCTELDGRYNDKCLSLWKISDLK